MFFKVKDIKGREGFINLGLIAFVRTDNKGVELHFLDAGKPMLILLENGGQEILNFINGKIN